MANLVPAASAEFETAGDVGAWQPWFGCTLAQSTVEALNGAGSLAITAQDAFIGLQLSNWPGWAVTPDAAEYTAQLSMFGPAGMTMVFTFEWRQDATALATFDVSVTTDGVGWATSPPVKSTPPAGTDHLYVTASADGSATNGGVYFMDAVSIDDATSGGPEEHAGGGQATQLGVGYGPGVGTPAVTGTGGAAELGLGYAAAGGTPATAGDGRATQLGLAYAAGQGVGHATIPGRDITVTAVLHLAWDAAQAVANPLATTQPVANPTTAAAPTVNALAAAAPTTNPTSAAAVVGNPATASLAPSPWTVGPPYLEET